MLTVTTVGVLIAGIDSRIVIVGLRQVAASIPSKLRGRRARANPSASAESPARVTWGSGPPRGVRASPRNL